MAVKTKSLDTFDNDIQKLQQQIEKAKQERKKYEESVLLKIGKAYAQLINLDNKDLTVEDILRDGQEELQNEILDIAGHYTFNDPKVKLEIEKLYENLAKHNIDGRRYVIDHIKRPIRDYVECYKLKGVTTRIKNIQ